MIKKITLILLFISLFSCENKTAKIEKKPALEYQKPETEEIVRPMKAHLLEKENDSIKKFYAILGNFEIWYNKTNRQDLINEIQLSYREGLFPEDYNLEKIKFLEEYIM